MRVLTCRGDRSLRSIAGIRRRGAIATDIQPRRRNVTVRIPVQMRICQTRVADAVRPGLALAGMGGSGGEDLRSGDTRQQREATQQEREV
jgi:hypothetical protein